MAKVRAQSANQEYIDKVLLLKRIINDLMDLVDDNFTSCNVLKKKLIIKQQVTLMGVATGIIKKKD